MAAAVAVERMLVVVLAVAVAMAAAVAVAWQIFTCLRQKTPRQTCGTPVVASRRPWAIFKRLNRPFAVFFC